MVLHVRRVRRDLRKYVPEFRNQLSQDSADISRNWTRGTKEWTQQVQSLISASWTQIQSMSQQGVKGVAGNIRALFALIAQADAADCT